MSEVAIWQPGEIEQHSAAPSGPLDDWIMVADKVVKLAEVICRSPFVPDGLRGSVPATAAAILTGRELGIPPMTSLANIHVVHGKPGLSALVMRALVMREGHEWMDVDVSNIRVVIKGRRKGESEWTEASFSAADATTAKLQLGGYPQDKLYARATARLARRKFADVIAGMPYSAEELEDDIEPGDVTLPGEPAMQPAKPRTAQRKQRTPKDTPPAQAAQPSAADPPVSAGGALPPLPGEEDPSGASGAAPDDTTYDTPGTVQPQQLTAIWTVLGKVFHFGADEKDQARAVCAHIVQHDLESSNDLSRNEAKAVLDTLAHWQHQAAEHKEDARAWMLAAMAAPEAEASDGE